VILFALRKKLDKPLGHGTLKHCIQVLDTDNFKQFYAKVTKDIFIKQVDFDAMCLQTQSKNVTAILNFIRIIELFY